MTDAEKYLSEYIVNNWHFCPLPKSAINREMCKYWGCNFCSSCLVKNAKYLELKNIPKYEDEFDFLDNLRDSGVVNMFGAAPYIQEEYGYPLDKCNEILIKWIRSFDKEK